VFSPDRLNPTDAAILEAFVVPRYLSLFGALAFEMLSIGEAGRLLHVGCRTGYPDLKLVETFEDLEVLGIDPSPSAIELARHKAALHRDAPIRYHVQDSLPGELEPGVFTHALALHPMLRDSQRGELFSALRWLLCAGGQALIGLPLRGSFQEIIDLLREYALKYDEADFLKALELSLSARPTIETISEELEAAGFDDIDVEVRQATLAFDSGRAFVEDPATRLLILPEIRSWLPAADLGRPLDYVRDAIDKYWSEGKFELTLNVGCASARCPR
jgi:SAM-dependent methyltransferase